MDDSDLLPAILDSLPLAITSVAADGTILFVNEVAASNLSGSRESVVGRSLYEYFPTLEPATRERIRQTITRREVQHFVSEVMLPDGRQKFFDSAYCPAMNERGEVLAVQVLALDVTQDQLAAQQQFRLAGLWGVVSDDLSMTADRVRAILETAPVVFSICDRDMKVRYLNRVVTGYSIEAVVGRSALDFAREQDRPLLHAAYASVIETRAPASCEFISVTGRSWLSRLAPLLHEGEVQQILGCSLDVTEQRRLQTQLAHKHKVESLGVMARGIAHDFNNLLATIMGNTGLVRRRAAAGRDVEPLLDEIDRASLQAAELCEQMLLFAGGDGASSEPADLNQVIRDIGSLTRAAVRVSITIDYDLAPELPLARCNSAQLGQVVLNLINNAADAIGNTTGEISVSTAVVDVDGPLDGYVPAPPAPGRYVRLRVTDSGPGIDREAQQRIFDPFYSTRQTGHGLGLSVVMGILASHSAAIAVESAPGAGTAMTVLLPIHARPAGDERAPCANAWTPGAGLVLVVDDEAPLRRMTAALLVDAGYAVTEAETGAAALAILDQRGHEIAAVLLDITMPGLDGFATLAALRELFPRLPVVLSSGRSIEQPTADPRLHVLPKPYSADRLTETIANAIADR